MMSAKAKAGTSHSTGIMKWKAKTTGTVYFALKVGTNKSSFNYSFDNFTLTDLTAISETGINEIGNDDTLYTLEGSVLSMDKGSRAYNMCGQAIGPGQKQTGIYLITNGKRAQKVIIK
jgi:hypothetical protein